MRWESETKAAAEHLGWSVVESDGVSDYQGWGVHLLTRPVDPDRSIARDAELDGRPELAERIRAQAAKEWAVMHWSYGSCGGCDAYEDELYGGTWTEAGYEDKPRGPDRLAELFGDCIEPVQGDEEAARLAYAGRKGW